MEEFESIKQEEPGVDTEIVEDATPIVVNNTHDMDKNDEMATAPINVNNLGGTQTTTTGPTTRSAVSNSIKQRRMLKELDTSYNKINDLRVTGDTSVSPMRMNTRSTSSTHFVVPYDPVAVYETSNEGGEKVEQHFHFCYNTAVQSDPGEPRSFKQAMASEEKEWWTKAIISEINNFLKRQAWKFVKKAM